MMVYTYPLDMVPKGPQKTVVRLNQFDEDFTLAFSLYASFGEFTLQEGTTARIRGTKPDGHAYSVDCTVNVEAGTVTVAGDQQLTAAEGKGIFELTLYKNSKELNTANFEVWTEAAALSLNSIDSDSKVAELYEVENNADAIIAAGAQYASYQQALEDTAAQAAASAQTASDAATTATNKLNAFNEAYADDTEEWNRTYGAAMQLIDDKTAAIAALTTDAGTISRQALDLATAAANDAAENSTEVAAVKRAQTTMQLSLADMVNGGYVENGSLYLTHDGEVVAGPFTGFGGNGSGSGSGGASSGNNAAITVSNTSGWQAKTIAAGSPCVTSVTWSSIEEGNATGPGTLHVIVNGVTKAVLNVQQGEVLTDISDYLVNGSNIVKETVYDTYGNSRTINFSIEKVSISISSTFDSSTPYQGAISFPYTPVGAVQKNVYFYLDGQLLDTTVTSVSGRQMSYTIPQQSHGAHTFECYFEATINGQTVESNRLHFEIICIETLNTTPIIVSDFNRTAVGQYETVLIDYTVYDPIRMEAPVTISVNGAQAQSLTVDRTAHAFSYRADNPGALAVTIASGQASKTLTMTVTESDIHPEAVTDQLLLHLSAAGRSNSENSPAVWTYGSGNDQIAATFTGFNWTRDGWLLDGDGESCLRVMGGATVTVPFLIYESDFRNSGKTIEIEFASHNVFDYDVPIISCMSGDRGFQVFADHAVFKSARSEISTRFKTDTQLRLTLVVQPQTEHRLVMLYINGEYAGYSQYSGTDSFRQADPVGISIGNAECGVDVYAIRVYDRWLTDAEVLMNYIADRQNVADMLALYRSNDIEDDYGNIVIEKLPASLPYVICTGPESPQYKGDKKTIAFDFVEPANSARRLAATGVEVNVQGTSSQYYAVKNLKVKFKNGATVNGTAVIGFTIRDGAIEVNTFTLKADVASSESANNIVLAKLFDDLAKQLNIKTPPQRANSAVRQGVDGFPCVVFWDYGDGPEFIGKYNFNNDKGTFETFGFSEGDEVWDVRSNTSQLTKFHTATFGENWATEDLEAIYPEEYTDLTNIQPMTEFLFSTWQSAATGDALEEAVTYDGTTYTNDTAAYRLAKFKAGYPDLYDLDNAAFYYVFTLVLLMVDSRQKNEHLAFWHAAQKWWELIYDCDTAIGNDNRGNLTFEHWMEDIDQVNGEWVFNGADNVKWENFRQAFWPQAKAMYQRMRSSGMFSAPYISQLFSEWQAAWAKSIWNRDGQYKYLNPLYKDGTTTYLTMAYGSKKWQREEFLDWRFTYCDSLFDVADALLSITFRPYYQVTEEQRANGDVDIVVDCYKKSYVTVLWDDTKVSHRVVGNTLSCNVENPLASANDAVCGIHNAKMVKDVHGLENLYVGFWDSTNAPNLQAIRLGSNASGYENRSTKTVSVGANHKLRHVDLRNCVNFGTDDQKTLDLSQCPNIQKVYLDGTQAMGVDLPNGGVLDTLHLPATVTSIVLRNHPKLTDANLVVADYDNVDQLWLENMPGIDTLGLLQAVPAGTAVRITGFYWEAQDAVEIDGIFDLLDTMQGLAINGQGNVEEVATAQMSGTIHTDALTGAQIAGWAARYPMITVAADHTASYLTLKSWDGGSTIEVVTCSDGVPTTALPAVPPRTATAQYTYTAVGWNLQQDAQVADASCVTNVSEDRTVYAAYGRTVRQYTVTWKNTDSSTLATETYNYGATPSYKGTTPTYNGQTAQGWTPIIAAVTGNATYTATYIPTYTVCFYNGSTLLDTQTVQQGGSATYSGATPVKTGVENPGEYTFTGWSPSPTNVQSNLSCYAQFQEPQTWYDEEITDSWDTILTNIASGTFSYKPGNYKPLDLGTEGIVNMQIVGLNKDPLAAGGGNAKTSWISKELLNTSRRMNPSRSGDVGNYTVGTGAIGGWGESEIRTYMRETIKPLIPSNVRNAIKEVTKYSNIYNSAGSAVNNVTTTDDIWIPSKREMFGSGETQGPRYDDGFNANADRMKSKVGASGASWWWLRSADFSNGFTSVNTDGSSGNGNAYSAGGVAVGFCI